MYIILRLFSRKKNTHERSNTIQTQYDAAAKEQAYYKLYKESRIF